MEEKKAKQEEQVNPASASVSGATGGGDLMSDLASKLAMRRKGISGTQAGDDGYYIYIFKIILLLLVLFREKSFSRKISGKHKGGGYYIYIYF